MKSWRGTLTVLASALVAFTLIGLLGHVRGAAGSSLHIASGVGAVPPSTMVSVAPASAGDITVTPDAAMQTATAEWHLAPGQIDQSVGLVRADISVDQNPLHQHQKAWLVVADLPTASPASGVRYNRLVIVIDGKTGAYLYAYPVDPDQAQMTRIFGVHHATPAHHSIRSSSRGSNA